MNTRTTILNITLLCSACFTTNSFAGFIGSGSASGIFINPDPICFPSPPADTDPTCTGVDTNTFTTGKDAVGAGPTALQFSGSTFTNITKGDTFVIGILDYFNGSTFGGSSITNIDLQINTLSSDSDFVQQITILTELFLTPNSGESEVADADFIFFPDNPEFGSFRVFEGQSAQVEILAEFNSLHLRGFGDVTGAGFTSDSITAGVPTPPGLMLFVTGLLSLRSYSRGKKSATLQEKNIRAAKKSRWLRPKF